MPRGAMTSTAGAPPTGEQGSASPGSGKSSALLTADHYTQTP
jgi:hypothetical protein